MKIPSFFCLEKKATTGKKIFRSLRSLSRFSETNVHKEKARPEDERFARTSFFKKERSKEKGGHLKVSPKTPSERNLATLDEL